MTSFNNITSSITIAILGCVSSDSKSILLNSLFGDTYSDMNIKRTSLYYRQ